MIAGTKVVIGDRCKFKHLRGRRGVVVDEPNKSGYWGIFLRSKGDWPGCELWFPEDQLITEPASLDNQNG